MDDSNDALKEEAMRLVDDELEVFPPVKDYLEHLNYDLKSRKFMSTILENEHRRLEAKERKSNASRDDISGLRGVSPLPPPSQEQANSDQGEIEFLVWLARLNRLKIKIEYRIKQSTNLSILESHQMAGWDQYLIHTKSINSELEAELDFLNKEIQNIHNLQAAQQTELAKSLRLINDEWSNNNR